MNIKTESQDDYKNGSVIFRTEVGREAFMTDMPYAIFKEAVAQVAAIVAQKIIDEKMAEILEKVTPTAIANMAIAEAGAAVNETLHKKMPDKILEIEKHNKEVWLQPFFGHPKRIS